MILFKTCYLTLSHTPRTLLLRETSPISITEDGQMIVGHKNSQDLRRESL